MMDRQTIRQQTGSEARSKARPNARPDAQQSKVQGKVQGKARRLLGRANPGRANPLQSPSESSSPAAPSQASSPRASSQTSHPRRSAMLRRSRVWFLFVFGLWAVSLGAATLAARLLLDPTVVSSAPPAAPPLEEPSSPAAASNSSSPAPLPPNQLPSTLTSGQPPDPPPLAFNPAAQPGVALDDRTFHQSAETGNLPILALGLIAGSCAMSCLLVLRVLNPRRSPPQLQGNLVKPTIAKPASDKSASVKPPAATASPQVQAAQEAAIPVQSASVASEMTVPGSAAEPAPKAQSQSTAETITAAIVTVLSSDESLPLDWEEPSLADSLDLRQHQSLPFWS